MSHNRRRKWQELDRKRNMTPPNTIPSSISPLEMATVAPTHSPTHTRHNTRKSTIQGVRGETAGPVGFGWTQLQLPSYGQPSPSIYLFKIKYDTNSSTNRYMRLSEDGGEVKAGSVSCFRSPVSRHHVGSWQCFTGWQSGELDGERSFEWSSNNAPVGSPYMLHLQPFTRSCLHHLTKETHLYTFESVLLLL